MNWTRRDILGGFAGLVTLVAVAAASWPVVRRPWPVVLDFLSVGTIGSAGGLLAVVVFAIVAGRKPLNPFGRAKPGWARRMTFLHVAYLTGAAAFAVATALGGAVWMWPVGALWLAAAAWRIRAGWRADNP